MYFVGYILILAIDIFTFIIIAQVILSWLVAFDVINIRSPQAQNLVGLIRKITDPVYKPIQKYVPPIGGIDITPLIVIIGLSLIKSFVIYPLFY